MADEKETRESLAWKIIERIARAEQKELFKADRDYTLDLVRDVVNAIDGTRNKTGNDISKLSDSELNAEIERLSTTKTSTG